MSEEKYVWQWYQHNYLFFYFYFILYFFPKAFNNYYFYANIYNIHHTILIITILNSYQPQIYQLEAKLSSSHYQSAKPYYEVGTDFIPTHIWSGYFTQIQGNSSSMWKGVYVWVSFTKLKRGKRGQRVRDCEWNDPLRAEFGARVMISNTFSISSIDLCHTIASFSSD